LDVVDVVDPEPFELEFDDLEKVTVKTLDERNHFKIRAIHPNLDCRAASGGW
jgi:hypothetical protein